MATNATVPVFAPDGTLGDIPQENLPAAVRAGAKPGINVRDPQGNLGVVPADRVQDAVRAGGTMVPLGQQEIQHQGFWSTLGSDLVGLAKSIPEAFSGSIATVDSPEAYLAMKDRLARSAEQMTTSDADRKSSGRSLPYRITSQVAQAAGVNVPGMEQSAEQGDIGGVLGHASAIPATIAATEGAAKGLPPFLRRYSPGDLKASAGADFNTARAAAGPSRVETEAAGQTVLDALDKGDVGRKVPVTMRKFIQRVTAPDAEPLSYDEAREFYQAAGELSANERNGLTPSMQRLLNQYKAQLGDAIQETADRSGVGTEHGRGMSDYARAKRLEDNWDTVWNVTKKKIIPGLIGGGAAAEGYKYVRELTK